MLRIEQNKPCHLVHWRERKIIARRCYGMPLMGSTSLPVLFLPLSQPQPVSYLAKSIVLQMSWSDVFGTVSALCEGVFKNEGEKRELPVCPAGRCVDNTQLWCALNRNRLKSLWEFSLKQYWFQGSFIFSLSHFTRKLSSSLNLLVLLSSLEASYSRFRQVDFYGSIVSFMKLLLFYIGPFLSLADYGIFYCKIKIHLLGKTKHMLEWICCKEIKMLSPWSLLLASVFKCYPSSSVLEQNYLALV